MRYSGKGNYTFWKSLRLCARVAFSFSVRPLQLMTLPGSICSAFGILTGVAVVVYRLAVPEEFSQEVAGWASLMVAMLFLGGLQMIFFGILGEYAGRTYLRVNDEPQTSVRTIIRNGQENGPGSDGWWRDRRDMDTESLGAKAAVGDSGSGDR